MSVEEQLKRLESNDAIDAVIYFADNPDERALEPLLKIALDPDRMEDEQHYAAEACCSILGPNAFVERFAAEYASGYPWTQQLALLGVVSWARDKGQSFIDSCLDSGEPEVLSLAVRAASQVELGQLRDLLSHGDRAVVEAARERLQAEGHSTDAVETALKQLDSDDLDMRRSGAAYFSENPSLEAVDLLSRIGRDPSEPEGLRQRALDAISVTRDPSTLHHVLAVFESGDELSASLACRALGRYEDPGMISKLGEFMLAPGDEFLRSEAAHGLALLGDGDADYYLLRGLRDERVEVRQWSGDALGKLRLRDDQRPTVARELETALNDEEFEVRGYATRALGAVGDPDSREVLERLATGEDREAAWDAAWALADLDSPASLEAMRGVYDAVGNDVAIPVADYLERHGDDSDFGRGETMVVHGEARGFRLLGSLSPAVALDFVLEHLPGLDRPLDRVYGLGAAVRLGHDESVGYLLNMLDILPDWAGMELLHLGDARGLEPTLNAARSRYYNVAIAAIEALGAFGDPAAEDVLRERFEGPHDEYRRLAREALGRLGLDN